jgi:uncharacterized membrane protein
MDMSASKVRGGSKLLAPQISDYVLAAGTLAMLAAMVTALVRGQSEWSALPWPMWTHIATLAVALSLAPIMLLRQRGDRLHRWMGYVWLAAMITTALVSFAIPPPGKISPIWALSVLTLIISWQIWRTARNYDWRKHRIHVRGIVIGGLLIAGFFTFQFGRVFDRWISGLAGI